MSREYADLGGYLSEVGSREYADASGYVSETAASTPGPWPPLTEPKRLLALTAAAVVASGLTWCPFTPAAAAETITADKWQVALSEPVRSRPRLEAAAHQYVAFVKADPFAETPDLPKWHRPLNEPVVKSGRPVAAQQALAFAQPEDVTVSRWLLPLAEPQRLPPRLSTAAQQAVAFVKAALFAESVSLDRWLLPLQEPQRQPVGLAARHQLATAFWPLPLPNLDAAVGFWPIYPDRAPGRALATAQHPALAFVKAAPFAESVTADRWAQPFAQPTLRIASVAGVPATFAGPALPIVATADRWWQPLALPIAAKVRVQIDQPPLVYVTPAETVTLDKWHAAATIPVRTAQRPPGFIALAPAVTADATHWLQPFSQPATIKFSVAWGAIVTPALPVVASVAGWAQPASQPVRLQPRPITGEWKSPYFVPAPVDLVSVAWMLPLSAPWFPWPTVDRQAWTFDWTAAATKGLAVARVGNGAVDIFGPSTGLADARGAEGTAVARGPIGTAEPRT